MITQEKIEEVLDEHIRPILKVDGGNIKVDKVHNDGTISIFFTGRCAGCPGADFTFESVVIPSLKKHLPEVKKIVTVPWHI